MRGQVLPLRGVACSLVLLALFVPTLAADQDSSPVVVERLDAYLSSYEAQLSAVVADEVFEQRVRPSVSGAGVFDGGGAALRGGGDPGLNLNLRLESEMAFLRLPGDREWLGQRRVRVVNRVAVPPAPALTELLADDGRGIERAIAIVHEGSRYHLGTPRSVNVPTIPLELAHPRRRQAFDVKVAGTASLAGRPVTRVEFTERGPGTIVRFGDLSYAHAVVTLWVAADGSVHRGVVRLRGPGAVPTELDVTFAHNTTVGILVPVRMRETFLVDRGEGEGMATYTNFRRFTVSTRLLPGQ